METVMSAVSEAAIRLLRKVRAAFGEANCSSLRDAERIGQ